MKYALVVGSAIALFALTGCDTTGISTSISGVQLTEKTTENLRCGIAQYSANISVSCVVK